MYAFIGRFFPSRLYLLLMVFLVPVAPGAAQGLSVGGGQMALGDGVLDLGCGDLEVLGSGQLDLDNARVGNTLDVANAGTLNGDQGTLTLTGNWSNTGTFNPGTGTVEITDGCASSGSTLAGETTFYNLSATSSSGKPLVFTAGQTQQVQNALTLQGMVDNLLPIRSSSPGSPAYLQLDEAGSQSIAYVDVQDNHAPEPGQFLAPGAPAQFNSVDSGGNLRWFLNALIPSLPVEPKPIPTTSGFGLLLLLAMMGGLLAFRGRRT